MKPFVPRSNTLGIDPAKPPKDRYRVIGRIASGGMAEIFLGRIANKAGVLKEVVLKRLLPALQEDLEFVQMFYDEARIASQMSHPNIVEIYELGMIEGSLFISMELIRGVNLKELVERANVSGQAIGAARAARIVVGALEGLGYAHTFADENGAPMNIVHRDISPQNILVTFDGRVKVVDFGVAKAEDRLHQTRQGLVKGKFAYMSPEQILGGKVDGRTDLYALTEVLFLMALNRHPFMTDGNEQNLLTNVISQPPPTPLSIDPGFPPALNAIILRGLQRSLDARYANANAMKAELEAFLGEHYVGSREALGTYVSTLFNDRLTKEQQARATNDDQLLCEAIRVQTKARPKEGSRATGAPAAPAAPPAPATVPPNAPTQPIVAASRPEIRALSSDLDISEALEIGESTTAPSDEDEVQTGSASVAGSEEEANATVMHFVAPSRSSSSVSIPSPVVASSTVRVSPSKVEPPPPQVVEGQDPNTVMIGRYEVLERSNADTFGEILLACTRNEEGFEKRFVIRRITPRLCTERSFVDSLVRETKLAARLYHPNIVQTYDLGRDNALWYIVTEYVPGTDLVRLLADSKRRTQRVPINIACRIVSEIVEALAAAHEEKDASGAPTLHRNVSPDRIIITRGGSVKLKDYGLFNSAAMSATVTGTYEIRGRADYLAPEQLAREHGQPEARSDVYAAGMLLYELLTSESPFKRGSSFETIVSALHDDLPPPSSLRPDIPPALEAIVVKATARAAADRPESAAAFARELLRFVGRTGNAASEAEVAQWMTSLTQPAAQARPTPEETTEDMISAQQGSREN